MFWGVLRSTCWIHKMPKYIHLASFLGLGKWILDVGYCHEQKHTCNTYYLGHPKGYEQYGLFIVRNQLPVEVYYLCIVQSTVKYV